MNPPWPAIRWPQSLTPLSRLIADITRPPKKPISAITSDSPNACHGVNGVIHHRLAPSTEADSTPPRKPSQVFDGDSLGAILVRPNILPKTYCSTSDDWTTTTRKAISRIDLPA